MSRVNKRVNEINRQFLKDEGHMKTNKSVVFFSTVELVNNFHFL